MADEIRNAYEKAKTDISNLISFLECEIKKEPITLDWSYVNNLNRIKDGFIETLTAIRSMQSTDGS